MTAKQGAVTGWREAFLSNYVRFTNRKARGRGGHLGPDKANKPVRIKPPWRS